MSVVVMGTLRFPPESIGAIRPHLQKLVELTRRHDVCIAYDVGEDLFDPGLIRFSELWPDSETLTRHLNAPHIAPWRAVAAQHGVHGREFTAYDTERARPV